MECIEERSSCEEESMMVSWDKVKHISSYHSYCHKQNGYKQK